MNSQEQKCFERGIQWTIQFIHNVSFPTNHPYGDIHRDTARTLQVYYVRYQSDWRQLKNLPRHMTEFRDSIADAGEIRHPYLSDYYLRGHKGQHGAKWALDVYINLAQKSELTKTDAPAHKRKGDDAGVSVELEGAKRMKTLLVVVGLNSGVNDASYAEIIRLKITNRSLRKKIESLYQHLERGSYKEVAVIKSEMTNRWQGLLTVETERVKAKQRRFMAAAQRLKNQEAALHAEKLEMKKMVPKLENHIQQLRSLVDSQPSSQKSILPVGPSLVDMRSGVGEESREHGEGGVDRNFGEAIAGMAEASRTVTQKTRGSSDTLETSDIDSEFCNLSSSTRKPKDSIIPQFKQKQQEADASDDLRSQVLSLSNKLVAAQKEFRSVLAEKQILEEELTQTTQLVDMIRARLMEEEGISIGNPTEHLFEYEESKSDVKDPGLKRDLRYLPKLEENVIISVKKEFD